MSLVFDGVNCSPIGDAVLSNVGGVLQVSGIGSSGLDGILLKIPAGIGAGNNVQVEHDYFNFSSGGLVRILTTETNKENIQFTRWEMVNYFDSEDNKVKWAYNNLLLPSNYNIIGSLAGTSVFDFGTSNPTNPEPTAAIPAWTGWIGPALAAFTLLKGLYDAIFGSTPPPKTTTIVEKDITRTLPDGTIEHIDERITSDPVALNMYVVGHGTYNIDTWGVKKEWDFLPVDNVRDVDVPKTTGIVIYAKNIANIKIHSINVIPIP